MSPPPSPSGWRASMRAARFSFLSFSSFLLRPRLETSGREGEDERREKRKIPRPGVKREEKLVGRIISVLSCRAFTLGGKLEKCYLPEATGHLRILVPFPLSAGGASALPSRRMSSSSSLRAAYLLDVKYAIENALSHRRSLSLSLSHPLCIDQRNIEFSRMGRRRRLLKHFQRNRYRDDRENDDKTIFAKFNGKTCWRVKSRMAVVSSRRASLNSA